MFIVPVAAYITEKNASFFTEKNAAYAIDNWQITNCMSKIINNKLTQSVPEYQIPFSL